MTEKPATRASQAPRDAQGPAPDPVSRPSRADTTEDTTAPPCLFCDRTQHEEIGASASWRVLLDNFPANPGHALLVPKRHVVSLWDMDGDESAELPGVLAYARELVAAKWGEPDGWTVGVNEGRAAGRSIDHLHVHVIPRHHGDVADPRGGIRRALPNGDPDAWLGATDA